MHFFTDMDLEGLDTVIMAGDDAHHLLHVLRAEPGTELEMTDACGRIYICTLRKAQKDRAVLAVGEEIPADRELPCHITLYPCVAKSDKMAFIIQKATELGVSEIVPVISERTVVRPDQKCAAHKRERWQKIAEAAAKQCGRARIPEIQPIKPIAEAVRQAGEAGLFMLPYECADDPVETRALMEQVRDCGHLSVMIGPEGGFSSEEVKTAQSEGAQVITLGKRILRAETAAITILSWLVYEMEI